ncbi:MAG: preprotein translocase subunit SecE [Leptodesmis sp.]|uniref:preprotein translocase subunit SecE n=1 Tax=Leptodesmis sp. TaxID=3100501 RepID=UPI003D10EE85
MRQGLSQKDNFPRTVLGLGIHSFTAAGDRQPVAKKEEAESQGTSSKFDVQGFLKETKEELDKVVWPTRQQLISESVAVVLMVVLSTTLIYLVDNFFGWASRQVFG